MLPVHTFRHLYIIFFTAFFLRLIWFIIVLLQNPSGFMLYDSWSYWNIVRNLEDFGVFSQGTGGNLFPDCVRTPVYPFFIFFLKKLWLGFYGVIIVQILISATTCALAGFIAGKIFHEKKAGLLTGILLAFDFPSIFFANTLMTETLFTFLLLLSFVIFIRAVRSGMLDAGSQRFHHARLIISALLLALAILCRPVAIFLPVIFAGSLFFQQYKIKKSIIFLFVCYLAIAPWVIRNYATFGSPALSIIGEITLLNYTAAPVRAATEQKPVVKIRKGYRAIALKHYDWTNPSEAIRYAEFSRNEFFRIARENPILMLKNYGISFFYFFTKPLRNYIDIQLGFTRKYNSAKNWETIKNTSVTAFVLVVFQFLILLLPLSGMFFFFRTKSIKYTLPVVLVLIIIFYFAFFSAITEVDARMRVPVMPFLCMMVFALRRDAGKG